jgi:hypothetical protein
VSPIALLALALATASAPPPVLAAPPSPGNGALDAAAAAGSSGLVRVPQDAPTLAQAISQVADGGIIELAGATYAAPASGFKVGNAGKGFTIRAAPGTTVVLDGGGQHPVFVLRNSGRAHGRLIVFENLIFRNGGGGSSVNSPGVTVDAGEARFVGCSFETNAGATGADGGGVKVRNGSDAAFIGCSFTGNSSPIAGGAMMVNLSNVEVVGGAFVGNRVNVPPYDPSSHGGAINVIDGSLDVSDALFQGNQAGWVGGAIIAFGTQAAAPVNVSIRRSTFLANVIAPQPCCPPLAVPTGGAIHVEEQVSLDVQDSRFVDNAGQFGGAISNYRALVNVAGSTFQGNGGTVTGAFESVGGVICALTNGTTSGGQLPRPAAVTVSGSLLQGAHGGGGGGPVANAGGCILAQGDQQDLYGQGGVPPQGTLDSTRAALQVTGSVFDHCDIQASPSTGGGQGGAINGSLVALTLADSLVLESRAAGSGSGGGGIFLGSESAAHISQTTFAGNAADIAGGAIFGAGSDVEIGGSRFIANQAGPGGPQAINASRGAALYFIPSLGGQPHAGSGDAGGSVAGTLFSQDIGLPVWDVDFGGPSPVDTIQYNGNEFFETTFRDRVYVDTFADPGRNGFNVAGLNSLVINRAGGPTTVKSAVPNLALGGPPARGSLRVIPPSGSPSARSAPFLAYAWSGNAATLNGAALPQHQGLIEDAAPGSYSLVVDGTPVDAATIAAPGCTSDPVLCLSNDRFHVQVQWEANGQRGDGHPVALSGDTGYFWFFASANVELIVKVLDGRPLNGRFWVFYGALSNVRYTLIVTDTVTGAVKAYVNPQGKLASVADTSAFLGTGNAPPAPPVVPPQPPPAGPCAAGSADLCLGNRFRVSVSWHTSTGAGNGTAVPLTGDTGYFWFFNSANVELVLKILDGRTLNNHFWVFYGALSNVGYTITVTDTQTGRTKRYVNPPGTMASVADTSALPGP